MRVQLGHDVVHVADIDKLAASDTEILQIAELTPDDHADLIASNLPSVAAALEAGAIVTITPSRVHVRDLPIDG